jgi:putative peptide zinc metalloprotease protein
VKKVRFFSTLAVLAAIVLAVLFVPLPYHVYCPLELQPRDAATVYVTVPGLLEQVHVEPGTRVEEGQILAELSSAQVELGIVQSQGREKELNAELESLKKQRHDRETEMASRQIPSVLESLDKEREILAERREEHGRLTLAAPSSGIVLPPTLVPEPPEDTATLASWSGHPMDAKNLGCQLTTGQLFCLIGDPAQLEARIIIDQADLDFIAAGQRVEICLDAVPGRIIDAKIEVVSEGALRQAPQRLSNKAGGELPTVTDPSGREVPMSPSYPALVPLPDDPEGVLSIGMRGRAKIHTASRTLGQRIWRYVTRTFNFTL